MALFVSLAVIAFLVVAAAVCAWVFWPSMRSQRRSERAPDLASAHTEPDFTILSVTGQRPRQVTNMTRPSGAHKMPGGSRDFVPVEIKDNPTGICKLTGKKVVDCSCERHKGRR
jgi:hypothetical protein